MDRRDQRQIPQLQHRLDHDIPGHGLRDVLDDLAGPGPQSGPAAAQRAHIGKLFVALAVEFDPGMPVDQMPTARQLRQDRTGTVDEADIPEAVFSAGTTPHDP